MNDNRPRLMTGRRAAVAAAAAAIASTAAVNFEGLRLVAYYDPVKIPTICVGRTQGVKMGDRATREQCMAWLGEEMMQAIEQVQRCHPSLEFKPHELAAYADIVYNVGPTPVCNTARSTMARKLAAGQIQAACLEFPKWDKARIGSTYVALPGLTKRRAVNMATCQGKAA